MQRTDAAAYLAGIKQTERAQASEPTNLHVISGTVGEASEDGKVQIAIDGLIFSESDSQYIEVDTIGGLQEGDIATILLTGESGHAMTPLAIGGVGTIDRINVRIKSIEADYVKAELLEAATARIGELEADHVTVDDFEAATGRIGALEADHVTVAEFRAEQGYIDTLQANTADIANIRANAAKVRNLTAAELETDHATISQLDTNFAHADMANVSNAWIENGTVKDGAITNAMIGSLSANKLTAGTINGSEINVTNLNADNITAGTINGQRIGEGSLSLSKLEEDVYTEDEVDAKLRTMQSQIDGAIETWTGTAVPTLNNTPASGWTTTALKDAHVGDVYFVVNSQSQQNGYNYRFTKTGSTYSWQLIKDNDVTNALQRLTTAEGKITTFDSDISQLKTDTGSLTTRTTTLETSIGDKVDVTEFNELSDTVEGHTQSITKLTNSSTTLANPNLSPFFSWPLDDRYIAATNPDGYWNSISSYESGYVTALSDGWIHVERETNTSDATTYVTIYASSVWQQNNTPLKNSTVYTVIGEIRNRTSENTDSYLTLVSSTTSNAIGMFATAIGGNNSSGKLVNIEKELRGTATTRSSFSNSTTVTRTIVSISPGESVSFDLRLSIYEGIYDGPYKPYVGPSQAVDIRKTAVQVSSIEHTVEGIGTRVGSLETTITTKADNSTVETVSNNLSTLQQDVNGFKTTVSSTYATKESVDNIQIGGKNLFKGSGTSTLNGWTKESATVSDGVATITKSSSGNSRIYQMPANGYWSWEVGQTYTVSVDAKGDHDGCVLRLNPHSNTGVGYKEVTLTTEWARYAYTFTVVTASTSSMGFNVYGTTGDVIQLRYPKLERGTKATDWTPAPEDMATGSALTSVTERVSQAESTIEQHTNSISLKANSSDVYTKTQSDGLISTEVTNRNAAIKAATDAITLSVSETYSTKTEASQMAQPNLAPLFSMDHSSLYDATTNPDGYWRLKLTGYGFTQLDDGWTHFEYDNTSGTSTKYSYIRPARVPSIVPGNPYTILLEIRNNAPTGTGTHDTYLQQISNNQFWGNTSDEVIDADHVTTTTQVIFSACGASFVRRSYRLADTAHLTDESGWLFTYTIRTGDGCTNSLDLRMSIYEGIYDGPYKPYSGNVLYATQAELKVTADGITSEVEKVSSAKYVDSLTTSWTLANIKTYAAEGYAENWNVSSTADLRVGDTVYVKGTDSTRNCTVYIKTTVTQIRSASNFRGTSHGYEDVLPVDTIKSTINQSSDSVKIAANHVNIEGAAIFTSGRLSEEELNSTYDANGAAAAVQDNLDNLEIGGRNLLRYVVHNYADASGVIGVLSSYRGMYCAVDGGETYTISRRMIEGNRFWIEWSEQEPASGVILNPLSRDNTALKVTVDVPSEANWLFIYLSNQSDVINDGNIKVERGTKATDWTPATEDMASQNDLIGVRGRNLLRGTKDWSGSNGGASSITIGPDMYDGVYVASYTYTNTGNYVDFRSWNNSVVPKSDTYYTLSFWVKASEDIDYIYSYFYRSGAGPVERGYNSSGNTTVSADGAIATNVTTEWQRVWITWKTLKDISSDARSIIVARMYKAKMDGVTIYLAGVMFQEGNRGTAWECAPEDVDASIDANSTGLGIKWNYSAFSTANNGEAYICAWDASTGTFTDAAGWVWFNGTKRTVPKGMVNPNSWGNNRTVYVVCRLTSATATTGTNYIVWYDSGWKYNDKGISQSTTGAAIADWTWANTTDMVLASFVMLDADTSGMVDCQQYTPPLTSQQVTNGDTAYTKAAAAQATANAAAPKANAVKRTQRIYYRSNSSTLPNTPGTASSNWVTKADDGNAAWTKMHVAISSTHKYIYTCEQYEMADGTVGYTSVLLDNTITVIDGGNIITGSVKANSIDAYSGKFSTANIPELTADHIKASVINAVNNGTGTINADKINVSAIRIGQSQVNNLETNLAAKANSSDVYTKTETGNAISTAVNAVEIGGRNLLAYSGTGKNWHYSSFANGVYTRSTTATSENYVDGRTVAPLELGETYTLSAWMKTNSQVSSVDMFLYDHAVKTIRSKNLGEITTEWAFYTLTVTMPDSWASGTNTVDGWHARFDNNGSKTSGTEAILYVKEPKLERGNKPTDWTPAPEDVSADISTKLDASYNRIWYAECSTVAATTAKVATITPTTTSFTLVKGQTVNVLFTATNTAAVGDITLNVNNTGAKGIRYLNNGALANLPNANYLRTNQIVTFTYDGSYWVADFSYYDSSGITNARYRTQNPNAIKAATAIDSAHIICGTSAGYKNIAANVEFNLDYPLLYATAAITAASTGTSNYLTYNAVNVANNGDVQGVATNKMVYLKGTVTGNTFKIAASNFLTCTVPSSADGVYIPLGIAYNTTPNIYFSSNKDLYAYVDGAFGPVSIREASAAAKTATNYISADSNGIKIANANPATATTYQHLTATSTDFVVEGDSMLELNGTNGLRIGKTSENYINIDNDSIDLMDRTAKMGSFKFTDRGANANYDIDRTVTFGLRNEIGVVEVLERKSSLSDGWYDVITSLISHATYYGESGSTGGSKLGAIRIDSRYKNDGSDSVSIFSVQADRTVVDSGTQITLYSNDIEVRDPYGSEYDTVQLFHPTSLYSTGSVSVANQSWVSVANLTIPSTGTWMVVVTGDFAANATGRRVVGCTRNAAPSSTPAYDSQNSLIMAPANGAATKFNSSAIIDFDANDVYYAGVWQNSGSALQTRIMIKAVRLI